MPGTVPGAGDDAVVSEVRQGPCSLPIAHSLVEEATIIKKKKKAINLKLYESLHFAVLGDRILRDPALDWSVCAAV